MQSKDHALFIIASWIEPHTMPSTCCCSISICGMKEPIGGCFKTVSHWRVFFVITKWEKSSRIDPTRLDLRSNMDWNKRWPLRGHTGTTQVQFKNY